jgi:hypothetical protein
LEPFSEGIAARKTKSTSINPLLPPLPLVAESGMISEAVQTDLVSYGDSCAPGAPGDVPFRGAVQCTPKACGYCCR